MTAWPWAGRFGQRKGSEPARSIALRSVMNSPSRNRVQGRAEGTGTLPGGGSPPQILPGLPDGFRTADGGDWGILSATPTLAPMKPQAHRIIRIGIPSGDHYAMGPGKADLLEAILETGSISAAGRKLNMSYRRAWLLVDEMNKCFRGPAGPRPPRRSPWRRGGCHRARQGGAPALPRAPDAGLGVRQAALQALRRAPGGPPGMKQGPPVSGPCAAGGWPGYMPR